MNANLDRSELEFIAKRNGKPSPKATSADILRACAEYFHVTESELTAPGRVTRTRIVPMQVAMYLHRDLLGMGWARIAPVFNRDRTSIYQHQVAMNVHMLDDDVLRRMVDEVSKLALRAA